MRGDHPRARLVSRAGATPGAQTPHGTIDEPPGIEDMPKSNTATTTHQRLRDGAGLHLGSRASAVWRGFPEDNLRNITTPPCPKVPPGDEGQVDYAPEAVARPHRRSDTSAVGVCDGAGVLPSHLRAATHRGKPLGTGYFLPARCSSQG